MKKKTRVQRRYDSKFQSFLSSLSWERQRDREGERQKGERGREKERNGVSVGFVSRSRIMTRGFRGGRVEEGRRD